MWQSADILNDINTLTLKQIFWKTKTFLKKLQYRYLVESTKIESASIPYKTAISEGNGNTSKMVCRKWTYHKEVLPVNTLLQFENLFIKTWFDVPAAQMPMFL